jgi:FMN phosphatase YigB (HAD superfamily)
LISTILLDFGDSLISERIFISTGRSRMIQFLSNYYGWKNVAINFHNRFQEIEAGLWRRWGDRPPAVKEVAIRLAGIENLIREAGSQPTQEAVDGALQSLVEGAGRSPCLLDGARETVEELSKRFRLAVVSNGMDAYTRLCLEHHGLMQYFEVYTISELVNVEKPDPEIIRLTLRQMGVNPGEAVMVGNRSDVDVLCANRAGCLSVWYRHPGAPEHPEAKADFVISTLRELPALCSQLVSSSR